MQTIRKGHRLDNDLGCSTRVFIHIVYIVK